MVRFKAGGQNVLRRFLYVVPLLQELKTSSTETCRPDSHWGEMLPDAPGLGDGSMYVTLKQVTEEKGLKTFCSIHEHPEVFPGMLVSKRVYPALLRNPGCQIGFSKP